MAKAVSSSSILQQTPGLMVWKDEQSRYLGCNQRFAEMVGFGCPDLAVDKFDDDMLTPSAQSADIFRLQDREVISTQQSLMLLDVQEFVKQQVLVLLTRKTPLYNDKKQVIGTMCHLTEVHNKELLKLSQALLEIDKKTKQSQSYVLNKNTVHLTNREKESLFYILRGKSSRQIAEFLSISRRTVEVYIDNLKTKFSCSSKGELIEKAIAQGYLDYIPNSLMNRHFVETLI